MLTKASASQSQKHQQVSPGQFIGEQQYLAQAMAGQRQQEALASLFRSLSSLASSNGQHKHQAQQLQAGNQSLNCQQSNLNLVQNLGAANQASIDQTDANSIASSIQSVMAAAVMQQRLVTEAFGQQQQHQPQLMPLMTPARMPLNSSQAPGGAPSTLSAYLSPADQTAPVNYSFLEHQRATQALNQIQECDVQYQTMPTSLAGASNVQQQNQRINYCTICNKELCNKYFMKTHMLKMHGISLETEQQAASNNENGETEKSESRSKDDDEQLDVDRDDANESPECSSGSTNWRPPSRAGQSSPISRRSKTSLARLADGRQPAKSKSSSAKQATSVMNGFAGNSMGGVVCDICNKELCSKYFLKVHKQNTHGIMTDYQDAGQFVYPFVGALGAPPAFMAPSMPLNAGPGAVLPFPSFCLNQAASQRPGAGQAPFASGPSSAKRARPAAGEKQPKREPGARSRLDKGEFANDGRPAVDDSPDVFYEMIARQQQQQQQQSAQQQRPPFDSMSQMSALMCYGAMNPFAPASLSPTMIVEMILRNQHLFNRNNTTGNNQQQTGQTKTIGKGDSRAKTKGGSKEANSSRYFTHYTEACPMCDRRFKSIKWLKTHMMNDHKQEIAAYMQMMVQGLCGATKSQASVVAQELPPAPPLPMPQQQQQQQRQHSAGPCYALDFNSACAQLAQRQQPPSKQESTNRAPTPARTIHPDNNQSSIQQTAGPMQHDDQFGLMKSYLDQQQQQVMHATTTTTLGQLRCDQGAMNLSSPESNQNRLATLNNLNATRDASSSSSSASTTPRASPRSLPSPLRDDDHQRQVDLSIKFNQDDFLQASHHCTTVRIGEFSDDDRSTSRSPRFEPDRFGGGGGEANARQSV